MHTQASTYTPHIHTHPQPPAPPNSHNDINLKEYFTEWMQLGGTTQVFCLKHLLKTTLFSSVLRVPCMCKCVCSCVKFVCVCVHAHICVGNDAKDTEWYVAVYLGNLVGFHCAFGPVYVLLTVMFFYCALRAHVRLYGKYTFTSHYNTYH